MIKKLVILLKENVLFLLKFYQMGFKTLHIILLTLSIFGLSCDSKSPSSTTPEVEIKKDTLIKSNIENKHLEENPQIEPQEELIGYWFTPHAATINIQFFEDGHFILNDYNVKTEQEEQLTGMFSLEAEKLTLNYNDRPSQSFRFYKGEENDGNYYIKNPGNYFVKGELPQTE